MGLQHEGQDFRIMASALIIIQDCFYVVFGTSSGHIILSKVKISYGRYSLQ